MHPPTHTISRGLRALHLRVAAHGAGVHGDQIGERLVLRQSEAALAQPAAQYLRIRFVLLTAVSVHEGETALAVDPLADLFAEAVLSGQLCL